MAQMNTTKQDQNNQSPSASSPEPSNPQTLTVKTTTTESTTEQEEEEMIQDPNTLDVDEDLSLQYRWALWYSAPKSKDKEKKWDTDRVKKVVEVGNVKEFWRYVGIA